MLNSKKYKITLVSILFLPMIFAFQNCGDLSSSFSEKNLSINELTSLNSEASSQQTESGQDSVPNSESTDNIQSPPVPNSESTDNTQSPPVPPNTQSIRSRLLSQVQPVTGMLSKTGWGENAIGGSNYIRVKTESELSSALKQSGNYVLIDKSLSGKSILLSKGLATKGDNVTLDGSEAPGFKIKNPGGFVSLRVLSNNVIVHNIMFEGPEEIRTTAIAILNGEHIWFDHITLTNFKSDDGFSIGDTNPDNLTRKITISNLKTDSTSFGSVLINVYNPDYEAGFYGYLTVHNSHLGANQRTVKNDGARYVHLFNNYIDGVLYSHVDAKNNNNLPKSAVVSSLSESNHFANQGGSNNCAERGTLDGVVYTNGLSIYEGNYQTCGDVIVANDQTNQVDIPPYDYELLSTVEVKNSVLNNAGVLK